ncbi:MAG: PduM family microcompartment protein [Shewanella sp.]
MSQIASIDINAIIQTVLDVLKRRENTVLKIDVATLAKGLPSSTYTGYGALYVPLADLAFIHELVIFNASTPAIATVLDALSYGVRLHITVHEQLLPLLPLAKLTRFPATIADQHDNLVHISTNKVVDYSLVVGLSGKWLLIPHHTLVTALANEQLIRRQIKLIRTE